VIVLDTHSKERKLPLLVDEKKGRAVAKRLGVPVPALAGPAFRRPGT
jgi:hypothetical protein